jgi:hypothetical protein
MKISSKNSASGYRIQYSILGEKCSKYFKVLPENSLPVGPDHYIRHQISQVGLVFTVQYKTEHLYSTLQCLSEQAVRQGFFSCQTTYTYVINATFWKNVL